MLFPSFQKGVFRVMCAEFYM